METSARIRLVAEELRIVLRTLRSEDRLEFHSRTNQNVTEPNDKEYFVGQTKKRMTAHRVVPLDRGVTLWAQGVTKVPTVALSNVPNSTPLPLTSYRRGWDVRERVRASPRKPVGESPKADLAAHLLAKRPHKLVCAHGGREGEGKAQPVLVTTNRRCSRSSGATGCVAVTPQGLRSV